MGSTVSANESCKSPTEQKENTNNYNRILPKVIKSLDKEIKRLRGEENKTESELKKEAENQSTGKNNERLNLLAKQLVHNRKQQEAYVNMKTNVNSVLMKANAAKTSENLGKTIRDAVSAIRSANSSLDLVNFDNVMKGFQSEAEKLGIAEDMIGNKCHIKIGEPQDRKSEEEAIKNVLGSFGVNYNSNSNSNKSETSINDKNININIKSHETKNEQQSSEVVGDGWTKEKTKIGKENSLSLEERFRAL